MWLLKVECPSYYLTGEGKKKRNAEDESARCERVRRTARDRV